MTDKRKSLKVHPGIHRDIKIHSAKTGLSIQSILEAAIVVVTKMTYGEMERVIKKYYADSNFKEIKKMTKSKSSSKK